MKKTQYEFLINGELIFSVKTKNYDEAVKKFFDSEIVKVYSD